MYTYQNQVNCQNNKHFVIDMVGEKFNKIMYLSLLSIFILGIISGIVININEINLFNMMPEQSCNFRKYVGLYCPGCGGTRSILHLLNGHFIKSFLYHPAVIYVATASLAYISSYTAHLISKGKIKFIKIKPIFFYVLIAIIFAQWIIKNAIVLLTGIYII